jgi:hypothetical protein
VGLGAPLSVQVATCQPSLSDEQRRVIGVYCVPLHGTISHAASVVLILKAARHLNA